MFRRFAETLFGLDTRSLAFFRMGLGLVVFLDAANRFPQLLMHYTDGGAMPRHAVLQHMSWDNYISVHMASGTAAWITILLVIHMLAGIALALGWKTRLATMIAWFLTISLQVRNPIVLHSGDVVIRLFLLWSIFLPLGARFSMDQRLAPPPPPAPRTHTSLATLALMAQLTFIYTFTWILKSGKEWQDGTAVYYAMHADHFVKQPEATMLLQQEQWLPLMTESVMWFELVAPALLLIPFFKGPLRTVLVFSFWGLHLGFFAFMRLGLFPWTCIIGWVAILPGWFWDKLGVKTSDAPPLRTPWWQQAIVGLLLFIALSWNVSGVNSRYPVPRPLRPVGQTLRLDQKWEMFAPYPMKDDGWYVIVGKLVDGREVNLGPATGPISWDKPEEPSALYGGQRMSKYMRNLWLKKYKNMRLYYGKYRCRTWNAGKGRTTPDALESHEMFFMKEVTPPPGETLPVEKLSIWKHNCWK